MKFSRTLEEWFALIYEHDPVLAEKVATDSLCHAEHVLVEGLFGPMPEKSVDAFCSDRAQ